MDSQVLTHWLMVGILGPVIWLLAIVGAASIAMGPCGEQIPVEITAEAELVDDAIELAVKREREAIEYRRRALVCEEGCRE